MSRGSKIGIVVGFLILAVALGVVGVTLSNVNAELDSTQTTLRATADDLAQKEAQNAALAQYKFEQSILCRPPEGTRVVQTWENYRC